MSCLVTEAHSVWLWLVALQREITADMALALRAHAGTGDWRALAAFLPWATAFGAAHALTPGHSKTVPGLFVAGSGAPLGRALRISTTLAATHIAVSVLIVLLALPVVSMVRGEQGSAPVLEDLSRVLLGLVGLWLIVSALRPAPTHLHGEGTGFGLAAGLIPCPLTLFVMTFAAARGVPGAGLAFAAMMLLGVAARRGAGRLAARALPGLAAVGRMALGLTGLVLVALGVSQLRG
jgi:ABC-type nickel/cobalt efflux system permease component RcnA